VEKDRGDQQTVIVPTPGRVVWFWPLGMKVEGKQAWAAMVTAVHSERLVNLSVYYPSGVQTPAQMVRLVQPGDPEPIGTDFCEWMPYQKGQASRVDVLQEAAAKLLSKVKEGEPLRASPRVIAETIAEVEKANVRDTETGRKDWLQPRGVFSVADVAKICHQSNMALCEALGDNSQVDWEIAPDWQKDSAMDGVNFHRFNPLAGPRGSHENWRALKTKEGWTYGPVKDAVKKEHPCMVSFDNLPRRQQAKDHLFVAIVKALTPFIDSEDEKENTAR